MRLVTFRTDDGTRAGRVEGDEVVELAPPDVGSLLASGPGWQQRAAVEGRRHAMSSLSLAPPVTNPPAIVCVGQNYAGHAAEVGADLPPYPTLFAKFSAALLGPSDPLALPAASSQVDWEVELAFVIGPAVSTNSGRNLSEAQALDAIVGYTVANDVSMRDWQGRTSQFLQGKTFEASTPVGPEIVTADEIGDANDLRLTCTVDGVVMQDGTTADLIFGPATIAAYLSTIMTLKPGLLVLTGTPSGVGAARRPPVFLRAGQELRTRIEKIGELCNQCTGPA
jgi:acylpyruvate hydrolase